MAAYYSTHEALEQVLESSMGSEPDFTDLSELESSSGREETTGRVRNSKNRYQGILAFSGGIDSPK